MLLQIPRRQLAWCRRLQDLSVNVTVSGRGDLLNPDRCAVWARGVTQSIEPERLSRRVSLPELVGSGLVLLGKGGRRHHDPRDRNLGCDSLPAGGQSDGGVLHAVVLNQKLLDLAGRTGCAIRAVAGADAGHVVESKFGEAVPDPVEVGIHERGQAVTAGGWLTASHAERDCHADNREDRHDAKG